MLTLKAKVRKVLKKERKSGRTNWNLKVVTATKI